MLERLKACGVVAVVRASTHEEAIGYVDACVNGGITAIELTYTIPDVLSLMKKVTEKHKNILLGVGSVLNSKMAEDAIAAGADFIVGPGYDHGANKTCHDKNVLYIPGCMTITEMMNAMANGNKMIKLFPGEVFGPSFVKSVKAPIPNAEIMPTGGVNIDNIEQWFACGVSCVGVGISLLKSKNLDTIQSLAREFVNKVEKIRNEI